MIPFALQTVSFHTRVKNMGLLIRPSFSMQTTFTVKPLFYWYFARSSDSCMAPVRRSWRKPGWSTITLSK